MYQVVDVNMKRAFLLFPLVELFATLVIVNTQENRNHIALKEYERLRKSLRILFPVDTIKQFPHPHFGNLNHDNETKCAEELTLLQNGLMNGSIWALKMIDASSKIPSGILKGNQVDLGMFDECMEISFNEDGHEIRGRHCMYHAMTELAGFPISQALSVCLPASCEPEDVKEIITSAVDPIRKLIGLNNSITIGETMCTSVDPPEWTIGEIATVCGFSLLLLFLVVCTICDAYVRYTRKKPPSNSCNGILCEFSLYSNAVRVLRAKTSPDSLPALQGLRFYSMCWIILGHAHTMEFFRPTLNPIEIGEWVPTWGFIYVIIAPYAVDSFFVISGFLLSHVFLKDMSNGGSFNLFRYYLHRYMRLTPAFMALLLCTIFIVPRLGSGAIWENSVKYEAQDCSDSWWTMPLYVHNYIKKPKQNCLDHAWYLAADMQFFWLSPLILYPLAKKPKIGLFILAACFMASVVVPVKIGYDNGYSTVLNKAPRQIPPNYMNNFYYPSHVRAAPWLIGIFFGYLNFTQKGLSSRQSIKWFGWLLATAAFSFCALTVKLVEDEDYVYDNIWETVYTALEKPAWGFGVSWIIYACSSGFGGPVSKFLSFSIYNPLGRLSYCTYLVHYQIQLMKSRSTRTVFYASNFKGFDRFLSDLLMSLIVGFIFNLVFETPFTLLEKMINKGKRRSNNDLKKNSKPGNEDNGIGNNIGDTRC